MTQSSFDELSLPRVREDLRLPATQALYHEQWMTVARDSPVEFLTWLNREVAQSSHRMTRTVIGRRYRLGDDLVGRHLERSRVAYVRYTAQSVAVEITYRELAERSQHVLKRWLDGGLQPGQRISIIRPFGSDLLISVLAAIRFGVAFDWVPVSGCALLLSWLENVPSDWVDVDERYETRVPANFARLPMADMHTLNDETLDLESRDYLSGEELMHIRPHQDGSLTQYCPVSIDKWFSAHLQDGAVSFEMGPSRRLGIIGAGFDEARLSVLFSVLLLGGTFVDLRGDGIEQLDIESLKLHTVLIDDESVFASTRRGVDLSTLAHLVIRDPRQRASCADWAAFIERCDLREAWMGNWVDDPQAGGGILLSPKRRGVATDDVTPHFGSTFNLNSAQQMDIVADLRRLWVEASAGDESEYVDSGHVLLKTVDGFRYLFCDCLGEAGFAYPAVPVEDSLRQIEGVLDLVALVMPSVQNRNVIELLVFAPGIKNSRRLMTALENQIRTQWGSRYIPREIILLDIYPIFDSMALNKDWCRQQRLRGQLKLRTDVRSLGLVSQARQLLDSMSSDV